MKKKPLVFYFFLIILLQACGYEPIYSSKNYLFKIDNINYENNRINNQIVNRLRSISNKDAKNFINLDIKSGKDKNVISKDKSGDPLIFELTIFADVVINGKQKKFIGKQLYSNKKNKFELNEYEIELEKQITDNIINEIFIYLGGL
tara:strand:- start:546 stop:986 length:441 start_codon:yes stop_codon:yes gene_type:complete